MEKLNTKEKHDALDKICDEMISVSQDTTQSSNMLKNTAMVLNDVVETQANVSNRSAVTAKDIGDMLNSSVDTVEVTFNELSDLLGTLIEQISSLEETFIMMKKIEEHVNSIDSLAARSKILALNATIESARFGDQGKGFAVVASEVKELAHTTEDISTQIITNIRDTNSFLTSKIGDNLKQAKAGGEQLKTTKKAIDKLKEVYGEKENCDSDKTLYGLISSFDLIASQADDVKKKTDLMRHV